MDKAFKASIILLIITALLIFFSPLININELLYPVRIDSSYVKLSQKAFYRQPGSDSIADADRFYYNPSHYGLNYRRLEVRNCENMLLKGWFIMANPSSPTLILLHDRNESKITFLKAAREFHDRGFNIVLMDLRAHGESEGLMQTFGKKEYEDVITVLDTVYKYVESEQVAILGKGTGANIALTVASLDSRVGCVVAQSPYNSLGAYIQRYADHKYGALGTGVYSLMYRQLTRLLTFEPHKVRYDSLVQKFSKPALFIGAIEDKQVPLEESYNLYRLCTSVNKNFYTIRNAGHDNIEEVVGSDYYNEISIFIISAFPKITVKSRFRNSA